MSKLIIGNWKMNLSISQSFNFIKKINKNNQQVAIAAPFTFLADMKKKAQAKGIKLSAQDVAPYEQGAYTGEVSAKMLKEVGCSFCLVGHSERRIYFNENDNLINQKIIQLEEYKIQPVLCVGENQTERQKGITKQVIKKQLKIGLSGIKSPERLIIAYEPVWAISTFQKGKIKKSAELIDIIEVHLYIKKTIKQSFGSRAKRIKVIYGGSVKPDNSKEILSLVEVDGALPGGASLKTSSFNAIIQAI